MLKVCKIIGAVLGITMGYLSISILGLISIFAPQYSDNLHQKLIDWAKNDD